MQKLYSLIKSLNAGVVWILRFLHILPSKEHLIESVETQMAWVRSFSDKELIEEVGIVLKSPRNEDPLERAYMEVLLIEAVLRLENRIKDEETEE